MNNRIHHILPSREFGGADVLAHLLAQDAERRQSGSACVWTPGRGRSEEQAKRVGLTVRHYTARNLGRDTKWSALLSNVVTGFKLRRVAPGIAHIHSTVLYGSLRLGFALSGLKRVAHVHLEEEDSTLRWAFKTPPELIITCARFLIDQLKSAVPLVAEGKVKVVAVPNCIDMDVYYPSSRHSAKEEVGAPEDVPMILMMANLSPHKGQETAIRAVAELARRRTRVCLWLAGVDREGTGEFERRLRTLSADLGVAEQVSFLGFRTDGPQLLRAADFFFLPSRQEGLPLSVLEAQATKILVVAAPCSGVPEVVCDGKTGFLVSPDDHIGYADRVKEMLIDKDRYHNITEAAYDSCMRWHNIKDYCERVWILYSNLDKP